MRWPIPVRPHEAGASLRISLCYCCCRLPPGQEIEPRQLSPHQVDRFGAKSLLLTQRVDAIDKIISHHGDNVQVVEKLHKLCLAVEQDGMKVLLMAVMCCGSVLLRGIPQFDFLVAGSAVHGSALESTYFWQRVK